MINKIEARNRLKSFTIEELQILKLLLEEEIKSR